jgi:hypothetical protein
VALVDLVTCLPLALGLCVGNCTFFVLFGLDAFGALGIGTKLTALSLICCMVMELRLTWNVACSVASSRGVIAGSRDNACAMFSGPFLYFHLKWNGPKNYCHRACLAVREVLHVEKNMIGLWSVHSVNICVGCWR